MEQYSRKVTRRLLGLEAISSDCTASAWAVSPEFPEMELVLLHRLAAIEDSVIQGVLCAVLVPDDTSELAVEFCEFDRALDGADSVW